MAARALLVTMVFGLAACPGPGDDTFEPWTLEDLAASEGFSVRIPEFEVPAGTEVQDCYFLEVPDLGTGGDLWIGKIKTAINPGSHHMNVFRVRTIYGLDPAQGEAIQLGPYPGTVVRNGPCFDSGNWSDWPLVANTQTSNPDDPYTTWELPDGVGLRLVAGETMMVQVHYVNATTQQTPFKGKVGINFYFDELETPEEMGTLFATQQSIRICASNPRPKYSGTCSFPQGDVTISAVNGHFHSRGQRFRVYDWDGQSTSTPPENKMFYESNDWDDPPMVTGLNLPVASGGGIWWTCEYQWYEPEVSCDVLNEKDPEQAGDCCYTFGPWVEYQEHCNVFLYYWPKVGSTDVFCN